MSPTSGPNLFRNPILPGFNPDPSITFHPSLGYFICVSSFEFWPGLPIYHSTDLVNWRLIGHAITRRSQGIDMRTVEPDGGLWAPTIRWVERLKKWYVACGCFYRFQPGVDTVTPRGFYVSTEDIFDDAAWSEATYFDELGIDQDLFFDDDGKVYLSVARQLILPNGDPIQGFKPAVYTTRIDLATGRSLSPSVLQRNSPTKVAEGAHLIKKDGWYYLFTAEGGTEEGHSECVFRSDSPVGPWEEPPSGLNPVLYNGDHPKISNTGHMDLVQGPNGKWWAVFLAVRPQFAPTANFLGNGMPSQLGRETFMASLEWKDGWPIINGGKRIEMVGEGEGMSFVDEPKEWRDDFRGVSQTLDPGWYFYRSPVKQFYSLTERPGYLAIYGSAYPFTMNESPSMVLQKQTQFSVDWSTDMEFEPDYQRQEAGTVVWISNKCYASIGVRGTKGETTGKELVCRTPKGDRTSHNELVFPISSSKPITFTIKARPTYYELHFATGSSEPRLAGKVETSFLNPLFTGTHFGLYATGGNGFSCLRPAYFTYAEWKSV